MVIKMKLLCAWCKKDMNTGEQLTNDEYFKLSEAAAHGICPECARKMEAGENIEDYCKHLGNED